MARLATIGFESSDPAVEFGGTAFGSGVLESTIVRTGAKSLKGVLAAGAGAQSFNIVAATANGTSLFVRAYVQFSALNATNQFFFTGISAAAALIAGVALKTDGTIALFDSTSTQVGSAFTPVAGRWYRIELRALLNAAPTTGNGTVELRVDGVTIASSTAANLGTSAINSCFIGKGSAVVAGVDGYYDDIGINDSSGANQNSWPGEGSVVLLLPTADSARGANWTGGAGGTTSLFDALNNEPPVGVVVASATNTSQIKNTANDTAGVYDATMQSYNTGAGSGKIGSVTLVQALAICGSGTALAVTHGAQVVSNPAIAETTIATAALAAGTHPTNWTRLAGTISYAPAVTLGTAPVLRLRKATASANTGMFDFAALLVEYVPPRYPLFRQPRVISQALERATNWMRRTTRRALPWVWTPARTA